MGASKNLLSEDACGFSRRKSYEKHRNTVVFRGFSKLFRPKRRLVGSDSEVFISALNKKKRREGDSNPRTPDEVNSLAGSPIRPLSHLSKGVAV